MNILDHIKEFKPTSWAIDNKKSVYIFTILIVFAGTSIFQSIPKEQFPDIAVPTVAVSTVYKFGSNPADVEALVSKPIENQMKSVKGVKKVTSRSLPNFSLVTVEFRTDVTGEQAKQRTADAVDKAKKDLPSDMDTDPQVQEFNFSEFPIMQVNISGDYPLAQLNKYAEELEERIEGLKEITRVDKIGAPQREIQVDLDLFKMQSMGISFTDVQRAIQAENVNISAGELKVGDLRRTLRITGEFDNAEQMERVLVRSARGNTMYLGDLGVIHDGFKEKQDFARFNNKPVITMNVIKRAGENLINASDKIAVIVEEYRTKNLPQGAHVDITGDSADKTKVQLNDLINTVIIGFVLVLFVLMFFMGLKSAFFVALAVPLSSLVAFLFMPSLGFTLNVIVLFSLLLAMGIIVDDAIVIIENTHRLFHQHKDWTIVQAAKAAAGEIFVPVFAGTLTTIAPFFPLLFWPGIVGEFMKYLPVTLILTLFASLFVAFIMNSVFAVDTMTRDEGRQSMRRELVIPTISFLASGISSHLAGYHGTGNFFLLFVLLTPINYYAFVPFAHYFQTKVWVGVINGYRKLVSALLKTKKRAAATIGATVLLLVLSIVLFSAASPKVDFFPQAEPNFCYTYVRFPDGQDGKTTDSLMRKIEDKVMDVIGRDNPNVESVISNVGIGVGDPREPEIVVTPHKGKIAVAFKSFEERHGYNTGKVLNDVREALKDVVPGAIISVEKEPSGPPVGKPINIELSGEDFDVLAAIQENVFKDIAGSGIEGIEELRSDLVRNKPEVLIKIDAEKAQAEGLSKGQIASELRTALFGTEVSKFRDVDDDAPIMIRLAPQYRGQLEYMLNMNMTYLDMATGQLRQVPISTFASVEYTNTYSSIIRKNFKRVVSLSSNVKEGYNANQIVQQIQKRLANIPLPEGYNIKMTGEQEDQAETASFLGNAFMGALALMFLILVIQFNSASKPFIIFSTVIFSLIGVLFGFTFSGMSFSVVMTGVGIFALSGIVIRNGILLLEFADELSKRGYEYKDSIIEAGATRITPVFLTAVCAILGLIPLAIGLNLDFQSLFQHFNGHFFLGGDNVAFWGPLAWTMIYGLIIATLLTLLVVPCMLYLYGLVRAKIVRFLFGDK